MGWNMRWRLAMRPLGVSVPANWKVVKWCAAMCARDVPT